MRQSQKNLEATDIYSYRRYLQQMLVMAGILLFSLVTGSVFAAVDPSCPVGDQMYYYGATPPSGAITPPSLNWTDRDTSNSYTVNGITFKLEFTEIDFLLQGYPKFGTENGVTTNAINMYHTSQNKDINHKLTASINKPISKYGFIVQDLDSNLNGLYVESISLVTNGGIFSNFRTNYFKFTNDNKTISGVGSPNWTNCGSVNCNFNVDWNSSTNNRFNANTPFTVTHGNIYQSASTTSSTGNHLMGYSDFYFCLTPPKLTVKKVLNGTRVKNTISSRDQFEIVVTGNSLAANSKVTAGTGSVIDSGTDTTNVLQLKELTNYTITERVLNGLSLGDISNYNASYKCTNATTGSTTTMPTSAMTYNSTNQTRSFTLEDVTYSDNITCIITNTPQYTFSGTVFDDNGGIPSIQADATNANFSSGPYANTNYFNGVFNANAPAESGIADSTVSLVNCTNSATVYATQQVAGNGTTIGQYQFNLPLSTFNGSTDICVIEDRTTGISTYPIRTSSAKINIGFVATTFNYINRNFGRVIPANAALVLRKAQFVNDCPSTLDYTASTLNTPGNTNPRMSFSESSIGENSIIPGQCIAYRITATNRSNLIINDFIMQDKLQKKGQEGALVTSVLAGPINNASDYSPTSSVPIGQNGTVVTKEFVLNPKTSLRFYFNTKYGTTIDP